MRPAGRWTRPYFFELFVLANFALIAVLAWDTLPITGSPPGHLGGFALALATQAAAGVAIRVIISLIRRDRAYLRAIATVRWITDTIRLIAFGALMVLTYCWIKLIVPIRHARLFDQELWEIDRILFFGASPVVFLLDVFSNDTFLRAIDWSYANIFFASTVVAFAWLFSDPGSRVRIAFANGNAMLWITGAWIYMLLPSLGPAYRFPDIWFAHSAVFEITQSLQAVLMRNYQNVLRAAAGENVLVPIRIVFGIGAFPSLHVAFQVYVFLWMRRLWTSGEVLFGVFALTIFLGSMITGWHYLIDAIAGVVLAYVCHRIFWRRSRLDRWLQLQALRI